MIDLSTIRHALNPQAALCGSSATVSGELIDGMFRVVVITLILFLVGLSGCRQVAENQGNPQAAQATADTIASANSLNRPPVAIAQSENFVPIRKEVVIGANDSYDPDGDELYYRWTLIQKPVDSVIGILDYKSKIIYLTPDISGTYVIELVVSDGHHFSSPAKVVLEALPPAIGSKITSITVNTKSSPEGGQKDIPISFGQVFARGDVPEGSTLAARTGFSSSVPLQVDVKALHGDGSLRHAVLTSILPSFQGSKSVGMEIVRNANSTLTDSLSLADLPADFDAVIKTNIGGAQYSASARDLLETTSPKLWLDGPLVAEWQVAGPLMNGSQAHPHLQARFYVRAYAGLENIRVSVVLENNWTWQPNPSNFVYDLSIDIDGTEVFSQSSVNHYGHARWRKVFWSGGKPDVHIAHDTDYLIATKAVPNYDRTVTPSQSAINANYASLQNSGGLLGRGLYRSYFPTTGAHPQIGPLPAWSALYILTQDAIAKKTEIWNSEQAGSFSVHYRDKNTDLPVTIVNYPNMTTHPNFGGQSNFVPRNDNSPYTADTAHQSSMGYLSYLVTGDYYFLEEMQFWSNQNSFGTGPNYRGYDKGLVIWQQVRGEGWSMRSLSHAAYITPDAHPLKSYFTTLLENNIAKYKQVLVDTDRSHKAPGNRSSKWWMDDFFTYSIGQTVELGFTTAVPVLEYMAQGSIGRMAAPGFCWIKAVPYEANGGHPTWADVFAANWPHLVGLTCNSPEFAQANGSSAGNMGSYADEPIGHGANMQPGLAVSVDSGITNASTAWENYTQRNPKQDYSQQPQFAIVPRSNNQMESNVISSQ